MEVDVDKITWTQMGRSLEVEDWQQTIIFDKIIQKFDHVCFLEQVVIVPLELGDMSAISCVVHLQPSWQCFLDLKKIYRYIEFLFTTRR